MNKQDKLALTHPIVQKLVSDFTPTLPARTEASHIAALQAAVHKRNRRAVKLVKNWTGDFVAAPSF